MLGKIWDKIELSFIRKKLEQRKARIAGTMMSKKSLDKDLKSMNSKALDEIKDKEREWHKIHKQMEKVVHGLRATGVIVEETEEQVIDKLRIPEATKHEILRSLLEKLVCLVLSRLAFVLLPSWLIRFYVVFVWLVGCVCVCLQRKAFYSDQRTQLKKKIEQDSVRWLFLHAFCYVVLLLSYCESYLILYCVVLQ